MAASRLVLGFPEILYDQPHLETRQVGNQSSKLEAGNWEKGYVGARLGTEQAHAEFSWNLGTFTWAQFACHT